MINIFAYNEEEVWQRDKRAPQYMLDARDHDWHWRLAEDTLSEPDNDQIDHSVLPVESHLHEVVALDSYLKSCYAVTA